MKPGADLEKRSHSAVNIGSTGGRLCDASQNLQQRTLTCSVRPDDSYHFSLLNFERDIFKRPERLRRRFPGAPQTRYQSSWQTDEIVVQRPMAHESVPLVGDLKRLA